jgi:hypothetical protein
MMRLKRISAGNYETPDGRYYIVKQVNSVYLSDIWWILGEVINDQCEHIDDFPSMKEARERLKGFVA